MPTPSTEPRTLTCVNSSGKLTLTKGEHTWTFSCEKGDEKSLLTRISQLAQDRSVPFDWFDAALVSHQLRNRLLPGLRREDAAPTHPGKSTH